METQALSRRILRFAAFELDLAAGELRRNGRKVKLQEQPFQILAMLLERPGEVVTREEVQQRLWPGDTYVDFDRGLNTAVKRLREALDDSASHPRFVETLPRRGYRFIAAVEGSSGVVQAAVAPAQPTAQAVPSEERGLRSKLRFQQALLAVTAIALLALAFVHFRQTPPEAPPAPLRRFAFTPPGASYNPHVTVSPDGSHIAYVAGQPGQRALWIQDLDQEEPRQIVAPGEATASPFWSPDSEFIAFHSGNELKKVSVRGGPALLVCQLPSLSLSMGGGSWSQDGDRIVFACQTASHRLYEVSAQGGEPELLFEPSEDRPYHVHPYLLPSEPGRQKLLYVAAKSYTDSQIEVRDLETGQREVVASGFNPVYAPTGHLVYNSSDPPAIWAMPFSIETLQRTGEPFLIRENAYNHSVARDGTLVYVEAQGRSPMQLVWRDRSGRKLEQVIGQPQPFIDHVALSPDERRVAVGSGQIYIHEVGRPLKMRLTFDSARTRRPIWSPGGDRIAYNTRPGDVFVKPADGTGEATALMATAAIEGVSDWSRDGQYILYHSRDDETTPVDIWYLKRKGDSGGWEPHPFLQTGSNERIGRFSPNGRFVAYLSDETGRPEVYVQEFPAGGGKRQVSFNLDPAVARQLAGGK